MQQLLAERAITAGHARALLTLQDPEAQTSLALRAAAEDFSVREVEDLVRAYTEPSSKRASSKAAPPAESNFGEAEEILSEQLQTRVRIQMGKRRGKIVVEFGSGDDLERIISEIVGSGRGIVPE